MVKRCDGAQDMLELIAELRMVTHDLVCPDSCEQDDSAAFSIAEFGKVAIGLGHDSLEADRLAGRPGGGE